MLVSVSLGSRLPMELILNSSLHEKIKELFFGRNQEQTWEHVRGNSDATGQRRPQTIWPKHLLVPALLQSPPLVFPYHGTYSLVTSSFLIMPSLSYPYIKKNKTKHLLRSDRQINLVCIFNVYNSMSLEISMYTHETITIKPINIPIPSQHFLLHPLLFLLFFMYMCGKST